MKGSPIPDPFEEHLNKYLLVDVRSGYFTEDTVMELPLRYGQTGLLHMWHEACAVEVFFENSIHAHEEARLLAELNFPSYVVSDSEAKHKRLRQMLAEQEKVSPRKPNLTAVI